MTTLTAPQPSASRRPRTAAFVVGAFVLAILVLSAITVSRLMSPASVTVPTPGVSWAPGGGGNEDHSTIPRQTVVGPQQPH
jgi:hypothetical protein